MLIQLATLFSFDAIEPVAEKKGLFDRLKASVLQMAQCSELPYAEFNFLSGQRLKMFAKHALRKSVGTNQRYAEAEHVNLLLLMFAAVTN
jgi:hypothetical protein